MLQDMTKPFRAMVDFEKGTIDRQIFCDDQIYQLELERVFARAWNFMCHESMIPNAGDFFLSYIGEESVICTRDKAGKLQTFLNSCRHRGNAVCRAEQGNTRSFLCTYHGWTYDLGGKLIGVPGYKDLYHEQLDRSQWGLVSAAKVASYKGFVFATMDPEAPDLDEYLGPVGRLGIDMIAERGDMVMIGGVQKNIIGCNWKLAVDNIFDFYHADISHASANVSGLRTRPKELNNQQDHRVTIGAYGHAIGGPRMTPVAWDYLEKVNKGEKPPVMDNLHEEWRLTPRVQDAMGDMIDTRGHPGIFPNLWITGVQLCLRLPKGPMKTELWWFTMAPSEWSEQERRSWLYRANHVFGPAGFLEQDDGENWDQSTRAMKGVVAGRYPINFQMDVGRGELKQSTQGSVYADTSVSEHPQLWTWKSWSEWMDADSWEALKRDHTDPKSLTVV